MGGLRHANFSLARGHTYGTAAAFLFRSEMAECSKVTEARVTAETGVIAETGVMDVPDQPYQPTDWKFPLRSLKKILNYSTSESYLIKITFRLALLVCLENDVHHSILRWDCQLVITLLVLKIITDKSVLKP